MQEAILRDGFLLFDAYACRFADIDSMAAMTILSFSGRTTAKPSTT